MQTNGTCRIKTTADAVHRQLNRPEVLKRCMPKCDEVTGTMGNGYEFVLSHGTGVFRMRFRGTLAFADVTPAKSYRLKIEGHSTFSGKVACQITLALTQRPHATLLDYQANLPLSGPLRLLGNDRVQTAFDHYVTAFFDALKSQIETVG